MVLAKPKTSEISIISRGYDAVSIFKNLAKNFLNRQSPGPKVVEENLVKGLENIRVLFNLNPKPADFGPKKLVLRDLQAANWVLKNTADFSKLVMGPNFSANDMGRLYKSCPQIKFFLAPSLAVKTTYRRHGLPENKIKVWPVGIDTQKFTVSPKENKTTDALIYFKRRRQEELTEVTGILKSLNQSFVILEYGEYNEVQFLKALAKCRYAVVLDGTESQGVAVQSIMSANLPMFVFDQIYLNDPKEPWVNENVMVTSVPFWSEPCGVKVSTDTFGKSKKSFLKIPESKNQFVEFLENLESYNPRSFILENLSLEKQAKELLEIFL